MSKTPVMRSWSNEMLASIRHIALFLLLTVPSIARAADDVSISDPAFDAKKGVWHYTVKSPYQKGENSVEVLLPDDFQKTETYRVLYILPVETGIGGHFGDGMKEIRALNSYNAHHFICVTMAFDTIPWYG